LIASIQILDWLFAAVGWTLATGGCLLLAWALFRDRSRGRRRCPKCWYDMAGVPGLVCPECGQDARSQKRLGKTRRRWKWAAASLVVLVLGYGTLEIPALRAGGWVGALPSTVLVLIAPDTEPPSAIQVLITTRPALLGPAGAPPSLDERLSTELWWRLEKERLWHWQAGLYFGRWARTNSPLNAGTPLTCRLPERWPASKAVPIFTVSNVRPPFVVDFRFPGQEWKERARGTDWGGVTQELPAPTGTGPISPEARIRFKHYTIRVTRLSSSVDIRPSKATLLDPLDSAEVNAQVLAALRPRMILRAGKLFLQYRDRANEPAWNAINYGTLFTAEVRTRDGRVLAVAQCRSEWVRPVWRVDEEVVLEPEMAAGRSGIDAAALRAEGTALVLRGDMPSSAEYYCDHPFGLPPRCWAGEVAIPISQAMSGPELNGAGATAGGKGER
jgi:hypothetical protein